MPAEKRRALRKLEESAETEESQFRDYSKSLNTLVDFSATIKDKSPDEIINAIKTVVDRIYVIRSGDGGKVNVFLKGEDIDYERFFEPSGYRNTLDLCAANCIRSVAFCCISTGVFRFPNKRAAEIAVRTVTDWLTAHPDGTDRVIFNVFKDEDREYYEKELY